MIIFLWPRITTRVPAAMVAVIVVTLLTHLLGLKVATIRSFFGELPSGLPGWHFPVVTLEKLRPLIGPAFAIAALGAIESLLSATVADGMADTRHDPNAELIGQGLANIAAPLAGGFAATGAIARTAANVRSGARSPVSGVVHALSLMGFVLHSLEVAIEKMHRDGVRILLTGVQPQPMKVLYRSGLVDKIGLENFCAHLDEALELCRRPGDDQTSTPRPVD